ncbi:MAG: MoaD/ThiS family protein [Phycisphaeraceae bacterium]|nr:MoaD/ThiS family protein [Phycisphaeraceae bacterium]
MILKVQLFGPLARTASCRVLDVEWPVAERACAVEVMHRLAEGNPMLRPLLTGARLAVNGQYAGPEDLVTESDELAVIAMVSGG